MKKAWLCSLIIFSLVPSAYASEEVGEFHLTRVKRTGILNPEERRSEFCIVGPEGTEIQISSVDTSESETKYFDTLYPTEIADVEKLVKLIQASKAGKLEEKSGSTADSAKIHRVRIHETYENPAFSIVLSSEGTGKTVRNQAPEAAALVKFIDQNCDR
jgi:hypothetical protein